MNATQTLKQMELDLRQYAKNNPHNKPAIEKRKQSLQVLRHELNENSYLRAQLQLAYEEIEKRKGNKPLQDENLALKTALGDKTRQLRAFTGYSRTDMPQKQSVFVAGFINLFLPELRKHPENIPPLLKSGILEKEAEAYPMLHNLIDELKNLVK